MSAFVYNEGTYNEEKSGELKLTFGLFFDGTKNNMYHTRLRKYAESHREIRYHNSEMTGEDWEAYYMYKHNESFTNDYTNVARTYKCCTDPYRIYIEGIGTVSKETKNKTDDNDGYVYGRGRTGIVEKVRSGCKMLAEKIFREKDKKESNNENEEITQINLTVDVFGFSRGAAAARHFLYNLQKQSYSPFLETIPSQGFSPPLPAFLTDEWGKKIKDEWLDEKKLLPPLGLFGIELLELNIPRKLIENMKINVRFLGIYDTVASYDPKSSLLPDFKEYIKKLHLNDIGNPMRAVHYTAMDEHRRFFPITHLNTEKLKNAIELSFPGAHSDIGGSYNHDPLTDEQFEKAIENSQLYNKMKSKRSPRTCEYEMLYLDDIFISTERVDVIIDNLIKGGWFFEDQIEKIYVNIKINSPIFLSSVYISFIEESGYTIITLAYGERPIEGGYSFIPLHFMCEDAQDFIPELDYYQVLDDYFLPDSFLITVKNFLKEHTVKNHLGWSLWHPENNTNPNPNIFMEEYELEETKSPNFFPPESIHLNDVTIRGYQSDYLLRKLRNRYLHCSARTNSFMDWLGHRSAPNGYRWDY
jgi:rhs element vgr protein